MPNTLQAGACIFPPFPKSPVPTCGSIIWVVLWLFCFRSTHSTFPQIDRPPLTGPFLRVPSLKITLQIGQNHLSIEASVTTTVSVIFAALYIRRWGFLSPPVQPAPWAHMHLSLSVRLFVTRQKVLDNNSCLEKYCKWTLCTNKA